MNTCRPTFCRQYLSRMLCGLVCGALLILTGCKSSGQKKPAGPEYDPLLGGMPAPPAAPSGAPSASRINGNNVLPLEREPGATTSTAALTTELNPPEDRGPKLRMGENAGRARLDGPRDEWRDPSESGVTLKQPEPLRATPIRPAGGEASSLPPKSTITRAGGVTSRIESVDQGLIQFQRRNAITDLKLLPDGLVRFIAIVPNASGGSTRQRYEYIAEDALTAVRAVLAQIERDEMEQEQ